MTSYLHRSLAVRVYGITFLVLIAGIATFAFLQVRREERIYREVVLAGARSTAGTVSTNVVHDMVLENYGGIDESLLQVSSLPGVLRLQICRPDGQVISDVRRVDGRTVHEFALAGMRLAVPARAAVTVEGADGDELVVWQPIAAGRLVGWLRATLDERPLRGIVRDQVLRAVLLSTLFVVICFSLLLWVFKGPIDAIRRLTDFARELDRHKGETVAVPHAAKEIEQLTGALNAASGELARSEQRLRQERERLSVTLASLGEAVLATDLEGRLQLMNRAAEQLIGIPPAEALGRPLRELFRSPAGEQDAGDRLQRLARNPAAGAETGLRIVGTDGTARSVAAVASPLQGPASETLGAVLVVRDLTEQERLAAEKRSLEAQLLQSQKMEALGQLAGGVAHDFNNILTAIIGGTSLAASALAQNDPAQEDLTQVLEAAQRASALTKSLLAFSHKQAIQPIPADLNALVQEAEKILRRLLGEDVHLEVQLAAGPLVMVADPGQVGQVLVNLAANARDAMPRGGTLTLSTGREAAPPASAWAGRPAPPAAVWLAVEDSGVGMDAETRQRVFEPFFTTKGTGRGTGLGLSIVHGIVTQHGGAIELESRLGAGTSFRLLFPASDAPLTGGATPDGQGDLRGQGTVLLVEDDDQVRRVLQRTLVEAGYTVLTAGDGRQGLAMLQEHRDRVDLLLSDVIMPEMNGAELASEARRHRPALPVLLMSGYTADVLERAVGSLAGIEIMQKPLPPRRLLAQLQLMLGGR